MSRILDILSRAHADFLAEETRRAQKRGPRGEAERAALRPVVEAHRARWLKEGGEARDFRLDALLIAVPAAAEEPEPAKRKGRR